MDRQILAGSLVLALLFVGALAPVLPGHSLNITWNSFQRFTSSLDYDFDPAVLQASNGTVWVFWEKAPFSAPWAEDIVYRTTNNPQPTYTASAWSPAQLLVASTAQDVAPDAAQLKNGTIFVSFASNRTGNFDIFLKRYNPGLGWSPDLQVTNNPGSEVVSSMVAASDGSLWLFWDRQNSAGTNIFYKVYRNGGWSSESPLTNDTLPVQDMQPSALQLSDGRIIVTWSQDADSTFKKVHILYKIFNGIAWSAPAQLTFSTPDRHPSVAQDSNSTIWVVWTREYQVTSTTYQDDLVYVTSTNGGASWSTESLLTNDLSCVDPNCYDDFQPSIAQLKDSRMYVFWSTDRDPDSYWDIYYVASNPLPAHNVAVTSLGATPLKLRAGGAVSVSVTVADLGNYSETFQVNVVAANKTTVPVGSQTVSLTPGSSLTLTFSWNTGTAPPGKYTITATIPPVPGEGNTSDNTLTFGTVWLLPPGDVNMDGRVDILDAALVGLAYGTSPGMTYWNPAADLNGDGVVNIFDAAIMALWYGTTT